ncbi:PDZ domain-containing protein [Scopulibacillus daqui]|uniref:endopeptidase La n=1 Tax=Scopulibacillus daqui TaxID=1469162 RepID=A0ABS2PX12_9BACL|nr:SepM family pheromone-processing serine protease [Scopulibacillus daqui]MBM7644245.1 PDZ domain-containing protein [Scopulibacillus daqui]
MSRRTKNITYYSVLIILIIAIGLYFYRLPVYVEKPGAAESINPVVKVQDGHKINGDFMLVYVYVGQANIYQYLWTKYDRNKYTTLMKPQEVKLPDETNEEYNLRQENYMETAQDTAAYVAYKHAGKDPKLIKDGALIINVFSDMPAAKVLKPGDVIIEANGNKISTIMDMQKVLEDKKPGDTVLLKVKRDGKIKNAKVKVTKYPKELSQGIKKYGIGVMQTDKFHVKVKPDIKFDIKNIGGPSAGLMMTLAIYDQLTKEDLAKGYKIAGTGTINLDDTVGPIGGIQEKIVGASKSGADIFFAPVADDEYKQAKEAAKDIGTRMKVVPVKTFDDALNYLHQLKKK